MKEVTTICTVEITGIDRHVNEEQMKMLSELSAEETRTALELGFRAALGADDVHVRDLKMFIRDE